MANHFVWNQFSNMEWQEYQRAYKLKSLACNNSVKNNASRLPYGKRKEMEKCWWNTLYNYYSANVRVLTQERVMAQKQTWHLLSVWGDRINNSPFGHPTLLPPNPPSPPTISRNSPISLFTYFWINNTVGWNDATFSYGDQIRYGL